MTGKVERVDRPPGAGQGLRVEQPGRQVASEAVDEHDGLAAVAVAQVAQHAVSRRHGLRGRSGVLVALRHEARLELGDEGVDLLLRRGGVGEHAEQPSDRYDVADLGDMAAQHPGRRRLDRAVDLVRLDLGDLVADGDLGALRDEPRDQRALLHDEAELRHARAS